MSEQHDDQPRKFITDVVHGSDGRLYVPAEDIPGMLRRFARHWSEGAAVGGLRRSLDGEQVQLDPVTLLSLANEMDRTADGIDLVLMTYRSDGNDRG